MARCQSLTRKGTQCTFRALPFSRYCTVHDPRVLRIGLLLLIAFIISFWSDLRGVGVPLPPWNTVVPMPTEVLVSTEIAPTVTSSSTVLSITPTIMLVPPSTDILFQDDFEDSVVGKQTPKKWNVDNPEYWEVRLDDEHGSKVYCVKATGDYVFARVGSMAWENYILEMDMKILMSSDNGSGNIQVRVHDTGFPMYVFNFFGENGAALVKETPSENDLASGNNIRLIDGQWYAIQVEVIGPNIKVFEGEDKRMLLEATDSDPIERGGIGLGAGLEYLSNSKYWDICFDNVRVTAISS